MENKEREGLRNFYRKDDSGLAFLLGNLVPLILTFIILAVVMAIGINTEKVSENIWYLIVVALSSQVSFLLTAIFVNKTQKVSFSALKINRNISIKMILLCVLISLVCFFGLYNFVGVVDYGFAQIGFNQTASSLPLENSWHLVLNLFLLGVLPAVFEEVVFRGIIFNGLRKSHSDTFAVLFSALLFAIMHGSLAQLIYPFIMGVVFSVVVLRTGNVVYSMTIHMLNNFMVIIFNYVFKMTGFSFGLSMTTLNIVLSIGIAIVAILALFLLDKFVFRHKMHEGMGQEREQSKGLGVYMVVGLVVCLFVFVMNTVTAFAY